MPELSYLDFDLLIEAVGSQYSARVLNSPAGQAEHKFLLPFSELELENFWLRLSRPRRGLRAVETVEMVAAREFGGGLFQAVFTDDIYAIFRNSLIEADGRGTGLRIRFRMEESRLASLPWEYLYDTRLNRFLALSTSTPLVRYMDLPQRLQPLHINLPLKILAVISSPAELPAIDSDREWNNLFSALDSLIRRGIIAVERLEDASLIALQRRLRRSEYHILHFIGHGSVDDATQSGNVLFTDEDGRATPVDGQTLGTILADHRSMRLVFLNSSEGTSFRAENAYGSLANSLVTRGIPAVLGMQFAISDRTAITFGQEFYSSLVDGYPVDAALTEARKSIFASGSDVEWGAPVLYMRVPDGKIFEISQTTGISEPNLIPSLEERSVLEAQNDRLEDLYNKGLKAFNREDWTLAHSYLRQINEIEPNFRDVGRRMQEIERRISAQQLVEAVRQANQRIPGLITRLSLYKTLDEIGTTPKEFEWLPASMMPNLEDDTREILPELLRIAKDISAGQDSDLYGQRLGLRDALTGLETLERRLETLLAGPEEQDEAQEKQSIWQRLVGSKPRSSSKEALELQKRLYARWLPVVQNWQKIILAELKTLEQQTPAGEIENPYEVGTPLRLNRKALFKGRMALRDAVVIALRESSRPTLVLHGPRRMGKTSFLLQLPALLPGKTVPVFIDLQRPATTSNDNAFFFTLARAITDAAKPYLINIPSPVRERFDERPYEAFDIWLYDIVVPRLQDNNLLLCMDEFEKAGQALDAKRLTSGVLDELRSLIQHQEKMAVLFAGVQTLDELGPNWSSYFINVRSLTIGYLETKEAEELIRNPDPEVEFPLKYQNEAVADILADTLGHPYLLQLVCSCVVEQANQQRTRRADVSLVEAGKKLALERGQPYFRNIWDEMAGPDGQALLRQAASVGVVHLTPSGAAQRQALERMVQLRVLRKSSSGYSVEVPLVARWVNEYAPD